MMNRYTVEYEEFLTDLADAIISAAELNPPLPELPPPLPRLSEITPLFPLKRPAPHAPPVQQPQPATVFPEHQNPLVFACVQLNPAGGVPNLEAPPWRPFGADGATIDYITQGIAVRDLNTSCEVDQIDTIAELSDLIKRASARSQTLVILADAGNAAEIIQAGVDLAHYPLFVLGQPGAIPMGPAPGANLAATVDALRAILIDQVPRLQSRMRALAKADLPSPIGKPIISASNG
jgi:hypothetical protein